MTPAQLEQFQYLLAGFVAARVFYGLTPYRRRRRLSGLCRR